MAGGLDMARIKCLRVCQEMEIKHYKSLNWIGYSTVAVYSTMCVGISLCTNARSEDTFSHSLLADSSAGSCINYLNAD